MAISWSPTYLNANAHSNDIKAIVVLEECASGFKFATAGRDGLIKLWNFCRETGQMVGEAGELGEHEGFVNSLLFLRDKEQFPEGVLLSGGGDKLINVCIPAATSKPVDDDTPAATTTNTGSWRCANTLIAHEGNVCKLRALPASSKPFSFASASWDGSARVWTTELNAKSSLQLKGEGVCWSVDGLGRDVFVTAHADRSLRLWRGDRAMLCIPEAHGDVIRDVLGLRQEAEAERFVSVGNDGALKLWSTEEGSLVKEILHAHPSFIYSLSNLWFEASECCCFFTCGEEGWVKAWRVTGCSASVEALSEIRVPLMSVWCSAALQDGTVIVGGSGGGLFIFSQDGRGQSSEAVVSAYESLMRVFTLSSSKKQEELEGMARDPSVLNQAGSGVGSSVIVRGLSGNDAELTAHQWDGQNWIHLGEVVSNLSPSRQRSDGDGEWYDFVFKVDVDDSGRVLELPYNAGENPYAVAQSFLERNDLPISYLDQVAAFITKNARSHQKIEAEEKEQLDCAPCAFPITDDPGCYRLPVYNQAGILKKLHEFGFPGQHEVITRKLMVQLLRSWPAGKIFPCLDWLRVDVLRHEDGDDVSLKEVLDATPLSSLLESPRPNKEIDAALNMTLRLYCNVLSRDAANLPDAFKSNLVQLVGHLSATMSMTDSLLLMLLGCLYNAGVKGAVISAAESMALLCNVLAALPTRYAPAVAAQRYLYAVISSARAAGRLPLASTIRKELQRQEWREQENWVKMQSLFRD